MHPPSQNKCFRYWPELHGSQEHGRVHVRNEAEHQAQGYCVRELQLWRPDQVSPEDGRHERPQSAWCQGAPRSALGVRRACAGRTPTLAGVCVPQPSGHSPGLDPGEQCPQVSLILGPRP